MHENRRFPYPDGYAPPRFRATIRGDRLQVTLWRPSLKRICPGEIERIAAADAAIADLWVEDAAGRNELIVRWLVEPATAAGCPRPLHEWATSLGYARIWLAGDAPLELDRTAAPVEVPIRCEWCDWEPETPDLGDWQLFRHRGMFPGGCSRCGNQLPQWRAGAVEVEERDRAGAELDADQPLAHERNTGEVA